MEIVNEKKKVVLKLKIFNVANNIINLGSQFRKFTKNISRAQLSLLRSWKSSVYVYIKFCQKCLEYFIASILRDRLFKRRISNSAH